MAEVLWVTLPALAVAVIVNVPEGVGARMVTVADPDFVTSAWATAETVTAAGFGTAAGAV